MGVYMGGTAQSSIIEHVACTGGMYAQDDRNGQKREHSWGGAEETGITIQ